MRYSVGINQHKVFLILPIYYLAMGLGLIGTKLAVIAIIGLPIVAYIPEALHYIKFNKLKSYSLNQLIFNSTWFIPSIKYSLLIGFLSGITANLLFPIGIEYSSFVLLSSMVYYFFYINDL